MAGLMTNERSVRSVFVGNIPYDATEEKLKDIFSEVGPVMSFRLVYDRETGKPKGYGFCEYKDQETALSAMRNLNGYELNGRTLRVDNAANEKTREEIRNLQSSLGGSFESPYGAEVEPEKAPEAISKAVASLPPEQMFELAKQMKQCIQTNPNEARNMLIQNPQLAYALLQSLVIMRIVEPAVALSILHRPSASIPPLRAPETSAAWGSVMAQQPQAPPMATSLPLPPMDPRIREAAVDPRLYAGPPQPIPAASLDPRIRQSQTPFDPRLNAQGSPGVRPSGGTGIPVRGNVVPPSAASTAAAAASSTQPPDQEKANLIMQVLQLSDQQIALLPPEQRQSIMILKEQISRGTN